MSQSDDSERFKPTWAKAQADTAFREDLDRGATRYEAYRRYKSRVRAAAKQHTAGPPPVSLKVSRGPAMQSQGGFHRSIWWTWLLKEQPRRRTRPKPASQRLRPATARLTTAVRVATCREVTERFVRWREKVPFRVQGFKGFGQEV